MSLLPYPLACKTARSLVVAWHSHCPDVHHMWAAIGVRQEDEDEPCGAVIVGPPPQEWMGTGIANLVRVVVGPEAPLGACSWLYAAGRKLARALGYPTVVTWTLDGDGVRAAERGTSLLADGWVEVRRGVGGGPHGRPSRPRPRPLSLFQEVVVAADEGPKVLWAHGDLTRFRCSCCGHVGQRCSCEADA